MDILYGTILVFGVSILELWAGIGIGFAFKLNPVITGISAALGSFLSAFIVSFLGDSIREKIIKWHSRKNKDLKNGRIYKIWNKYGIIGLGLLSPPLFGAPLAAALGIALGAQKKPLILWISIGIVLWITIFTGAIHLGFMNFQS